eukprot:TRINITY_DN45_c0_g1_i2.p1 TRINITY_DN45_c0_g1~~TRINITY_DN45_c0_g1_i2.p1  ORF type:complete len:56 (-),score=1.39 TRINITY_DN45_c0_g1_i2:123-290(-)
MTCKICTQLYESANLVLQKNTDLQQKLKMSPNFKRNNECMGACDIWRHRFVILST